MIDVRPKPVALLVDGHRAEPDQQEAEHAGRQQRADQGLGRRAPRIGGLLGERARAVEPVHHVERHDRAEQERSEVAPVVARARAVGLEEHRGAVLDVDDQQEDEAHGADELGDHADVVDPRDDAHAHQVHGRREDDHDGGEDERVLGERGVEDAGVVLVGAGRAGGRRDGALDELELGRDLRQDHLPRERDRRNRHDLRAEVDPAGVPGPRLARQPLRPLVDRARERKVRGELCELQRHRHLPEEDDRPGPDERAPGEEEAQRGGLEHAGQDRDVGEARGEARERPERAVQLLLVAERRKIVDVGVDRFTHEPS